MKSEKTDAILTKERSSKEPIFLTTKTESTTRAKTETSTVSRTANLAHTKNTLEYKDGGRMNSKLIGSGEFWTRLSLAGTLPVSILKMRSKYKRLKTLFKDHAQSSSHIHIGADHSFGQKI